MIFQEGGGGPDPLPPSGSAHGLLGYGCSVGIGVGRLATLSQSLYDGQLTKALFLDRPQLALNAACIQVVESNCN